MGEFNSLLMDQLVSLRVSVSNETARASHFSVVLKKETVSKWKKKREKKRKTYDQMNI